MVQQLYTLKRAAFTSQSSLIGNFRPSSFMRISKMPGHSESNSRNSPMTVKLSVLIECETRVLPAR